MSADDELRSLALQLALKCADLGHLTCPHDIHRAWVERLEAEFFSQARSLAWLVPQNVQAGSRAGDLYAKLLFKGPAVDFQSHLSTAQQHRAHT